jgi:hypothetical protein
MSPVNARETHKVTRVRSSDRRQALRPAVAASVAFVVTVRRAPWFRDRRRQALTSTKSDPPTHQSRCPNKPDGGVGWGWGCMGTRARVRACTGRDRDVPPNSAQQIYTLVCGCVSEWRCVRVCVYMGSWGRVWRSRKSD